MFYTFDNRQLSFSVDTRLVTNLIEPSDTAYLGYIAWFANNNSSTTAPQFNKLLPVNQNELLFSLIGTTYGGNGSTNFALPSLNGRVLVGESQQAPLGTELGGTDSLIYLDYRAPMSLPEIQNAATLAIHYRVQVNGLIPSPDVNDPSLSTVGMLHAYIGNPGDFNDGTLPADGRLLSITQNTALFSVLGTTYGGNGRTTFALPDLRGRTLIGASGDMPVGAVVGSSLVPFNQQAFNPLISGGGPLLENRTASVAVNFLVAETGRSRGSDDSVGFSGNFEPYAGQVVAFLGSRIPGGWSVADGRSLPFDGSPELSNLLQVDGSGNQVIQLPDFRGATMVFDANSTSLQLQGSNITTVVNQVAAKPLTATVQLSDITVEPGQTIEALITFNEPVVGFSSDDILAPGLIVGNSRFIDSNTYVVPLTAPETITMPIQGMITVLLNQVFTQARGATGGNAQSDTFMVSSGFEPPISAVLMLDDTQLNIGDSATLTVTFSEAVAGFTLADLSVDNGTLSSLSTNDNGVTWTSTFIPADGIEDVSNAITLNLAGVTDLSGNANEGTEQTTNYVIDTVRPTAMLTLDDTQLNIGETATLTVTFSEAVTELTNADLTVANGTLSTISSSDGGITWTSTFTPATVVHNAGNGVIDVTPNTVFAGLTMADLIAAIGGLPPRSYFDVGVIWPNTLTPAVGAEHAGNGVIVGTSNTTVFAGFTVADLIAAIQRLAPRSNIDGGVIWPNTLAPVVGVEQAGNGVILGTSNTVFAGFTLADLIAAIENLAPRSIIDGGRTWTGYVTPQVGFDGTNNVITLNLAGVTDLSGNAGVGTAQTANYVIGMGSQIVIPISAMLSLSDTQLKAGETATLTVTFSEAVTEFSNADLTVANGTLSTISSSDGGITWTGTFTPTAGIEAVNNFITLNLAGVTDLSGNAGVGTAQTTNYVIDTIRPTAMLSLSDRQLKIGETATLTVKFSEAVTELSNADLTVANGTLSTISSSDGGITWTSTFTPAAGIEDVNNVITLDLTGVSDFSGNAGVGTAQTTNYVIDTVRPTAMLTLDDTQLKIGETATLTVKFSEAVTELSNADLTVANGTLSTISSSDGGITWTSTFTPAAGIEDVNNVITLDLTGVSDFSGNAGVGTAQTTNYVIDTVLPTAMPISAALRLNDTQLKTGEKATLTVKFNQAVAGFSLADLAVANGTLSGISSSDGGVTWTSTFMPAVGIKDVSNVIILNLAGVTDLSGNAGEGSAQTTNYVIDTVRFSAMPISAMLSLSDTQLKTGEKATLTVKFNQAVAGFSLADLAVANGSLKSLSSSDGGITWTSTFIPAADVKDASNVITLNLAGVTDLSGNAGVGTAQTTNYVINTARPTAMLTLSDTQIKTGETATLTVKFNQAVAGFSLADLAVSNGSLKSLSSSDGGITWTSTFIPAADVKDASNVITLNLAGVTDVSGNAGVGKAQTTNYEIDTVLPTSMPISAILSLSDTQLKTGEKATLTVKFDQAVTGFSLTDLAVANGSLKSLSSSDGGVTWTSAFIPVAGIEDASNVITLDLAGVTNLSGKAGVGKAQTTNYVIDTARPTAMLTLSDTQLKTGETAMLTVKFNQAVVGFSLVDLAVANGTLSGISSGDGGVTWTSTFIPAAGIKDASNVITLNLAGVTDLSGNAGVGKVQTMNYVIDSLALVASTFNDAADGKIIGAAENFVLADGEQPIALVGLNLNFTSDDFQLL